MLLQEINEELNKWKSILYPWAGRLNSKDVNFPNELQFPKYQLKYQQDFFGGGRWGVDINRQILKFYEGTRDPEELKQF